MALTETAAVSFCEILVLCSQLEVGFQLLVLKTEAAFVSSFFCKKEHNFISTFAFCIQGHCSVSVITNTPHNLQICNSSQVGDFYLGVATVMLFTTFHRQVDFKNKSGSHLKLL